MIALPLGILWLAAIILAPFNGKRPWVVWTAVIALAAGFAAAIHQAIVIAQSGMLHSVTGDWPIGVGIRLAVDSLSSIFILLALGLLLCTMIYEALRGVIHRAFPSLALFLGAGLTGLFSTGDIFNFYVFFEIAMTASFVLTSFGDDARQSRDALIFMVVNLIGSALFLSAIAALYHVTGTLDMGEVAIWAAQAPPAVTMRIAVLIFTAFAVKLGLFPFHFWLPPVYRGAIPAIAAILSGVLANIGSYGLLRFGAHILPRELALGAPVLLVIGAASVIYGAVVAIRRPWSAEVLAYSSISQVGYLLIVLSLGGVIGYAAAVIYAVANALNKTLLFLAAPLRGWFVGIAFLAGAMSVTGLPPSVGFFGKAAVFRAALDESNAVLVGLLFVGAALAFVYMFQNYQRNFWKQAEGEPSNPALGVVVMVLALVVIGLGVWPEPLLAMSNEAGTLLAGGSPWPEP